MNHHYVHRFCMVMALFTIGIVGLGQAFGEGGDQAVMEEEVEVLARGPVHEAFAATVPFDPEPGITVPTAPPDAIEELPPKQTPGGGNVAWIPGYWAWDDERNDFIWVSGIWRALPPGRQWVPGYWAKAPQGFQWTSGYWADSRVSETEYLPEPPGTVEVGPNIHAPSPGYSWIPGCWIWHRGRYAWRPGYWVPVEPNWIWVPAYYVWTPRGHVFIDGYWDYPVALRGFLFAPVYFPSKVHRPRGFYYSPSVVVDLTVFTDCLFLHLSYGHYYFGDYYAAKYYAGGIFPWFSLHARRYGYDPIYAHQRWKHRKDPGWEHRIQNEFQRRRDHGEARPARRLATPAELSTKKGTPREKGHFVVRPFDQVVKSQGGSWRFRSLGNREREQIRQHEQEFRKFRDARQASESGALKPSAGSTSRQFEAAKVRHPSSPIMGRSLEHFGKNEGPPRRYVAPKPNTNVEPSPRRGEHGTGRRGGGYWR